MGPGSVLWDLAASHGTWQRPVAPGTALWNRFLSIVDTFIRLIPFESLTENDATAGAHMDRHVRELFYWLKHPFYMK